MRSLKDLEPFATHRVNWTAIGIQRQVSLGFNLGHVSLQARLGGPADQVEAKQALKSMKRG